MKDSILPHPPNHGIARKCPSCGKVLALKLVEKYKDKNGIVITTYKCRKCGEETEFSDKHPPGAV